jgi:hypothetical protein
MRKYFFISLLFLFCSNSIFSQSTSKNLTEDEVTRAICASYYIVEVQPVNYIFNTPSGEATANIILKAYREHLIIPTISMDNIDAGDKAKIEKLIIKLNQLSKNPPTWDELVLLEKEWLIARDKAMLKVSKYKSFD